MRLGHLSPLPQLSTVKWKVRSIQVHEFGIQLDADTSAALQVAGVSNSALRLTGDKFHQSKILTIAVWISRIVQMPWPSCNYGWLPCMPSRTRICSDRSGKLPKTLTGKLLPHRNNGQQGNRRIGSTTQHSQQLSGAAAEQHQALTHNLVVSNTTHSPEALMQEPHFQLADRGGRGLID